MHIGDSRVLGAVGSQGSEPDNLFSQNQWFNNTVAFLQVPGTHGEIPLIALKIHPPTGGELHLQSLRSEHTS